MASDRDAVHCFALGLPGAWPDSPWEGDLVAKVGPPEKGKIFAFLGGDSVGVKAGATREEADEWLDRYPDDASVIAYIGRSGWNTLRIGGALPLQELLDMQSTTRTEQRPLRARPHGMLTSWPPQRRSRT